jgi:hypothetical protein
MPDSPEGQRLKKIETLIHLLRWAARGADDFPFEMSLEFTNDVADRVQGGANAATHGR